MYAALRGDELRGCESRRSGNISVEWTNSDLRKKVEDINHQNVFENYMLELPPTSPMFEWVNSSMQCKHMVISVKFNNLIIQLKIADDLLKHRCHNNTTVWSPLDLNVLIFAHSGLSQIDITSNWSYLSAGNTIWVKLPAYMPVVYSVH